MEIANLIALNDMKELIRFIELYSGNDDSREQMIVQLLMATNPLFLKKIKNKKLSKNNIRKILDEYLMSLGLELEN
jgi:hypothetical protein